MFFDVFVELCAEKGISAYKACTEMGLNRSAVAKWKTGGTPNGSTLAMMADYFGVSTDYLLGKAQKEKPTEIGEHSEDGLKAAFFGGYSDNLSDEDVDELWDDAKEYMKFKLAQKKKTKE